MEAYFPSNFQLESAGAIEDEPANSALDLDSADVVPVIMEQG